MDVIARFSHILVDKICLPLVNENFQSIDKILHLKRNGLMLLRRMHWISKALATNNLAIKIFLQFQFYLLAAKMWLSSQLEHPTDELLFSSGRKLKIFIDA